MQLPPAVLAKMKARGIKMPSSNSIVVQHCMTAQEVSLERPPPMPKRAGNECKMANMKVAGQSVSADMVCSGKNMQGMGHFQMTYDSPEHYAGKMSFNMNANGHQMAMSNTMEGRWVSASCGAIKH
jgi:predicted component of type VI protein secretion system